MKIVIIDDDSNFSEKLKLYLKKKICIDADINISEMNYDLYFLDIDMHNINGIDYAKNIINNNSSANIIFISSYDHLVFDALKVKPLTFVRKNHFEEDMRFVINELLNMNITKTLSINKDISIPVETILSIEKYHSYSYVYTLNNQYKIRVSLSKLEKELSHYFIYISKGIIINVKFVKEINGDQIIMKNNTQYYISRRRKTEVTVKYIKYKESL